MVSATIFGDGVYFAVDAAYSTDPMYSIPNKDTGVQQMYLCKVLTARYTQGTKGLKEAPPIDTLRPEIKFNSVVDNKNNPTIFVIFHDMQAYPDYLITFMAD